MFRNLIAIGLVGVTGLSSAQDFPRSGYDGAPNGLASPFAGNWSLGFPETEGTIVAATIIDCASPVTIEATGEAAIAFKSPAMAAAVPYELNEFEGRTSWIPSDNSQTVVTVWLTPDSFHFYPTTMGKVDWDNPNLLNRCAA
jgi:hypothetical protein